MQQQNTTHSRTAFEPTAAGSFKESGRWNPGRLNFNRDGEPESSKRDLSVARTLPAGA
jgi:hypothetical protein